ncbi:hypothetical protein Trydic_g17344 [Trypoxylus dichotomus]
MEVTPPYARRTYSIAFTPKKEKEPKKCAVVLFPESTRDFEELVRANSPDDFVELSVESPPKKRRTEVKNRDALQKNLFDAQPSYRPLPSKLPSRRYPRRLLQVKLIDGFKFKQS